MEHPAITRVNRTGYPTNYKYIEPKSITISSTACDVCREYEAEIKYNNTKLCSHCCQEVDITIL